MRPTATADRRRARDTFFDEEARIPIWIYLPRALLEQDGVLEGLRQNADVPVSNADLVPTFLALTGLDRYQEIRARTEKLLGLPLTTALPVDRPLLMQNYNDMGGKALFYGVGLVKGRYKYLLRIEGSTVWEELYELEADPGEKHNLWDVTDEVTRESFRGELRKQRNSRQLVDKYIGEKP